MSSLSLALRPDGSQFAFSVLRLISRKDRTQAGDASFQRFSLVKRHVAGNRVHLHSEDVHISVISDSPAISEPARASDVRHTRLYVSGMVESQSKVFE